MGATRASHPRFRREGTAPRIELTDDDIAILQHVYRHRFIRADDLHRLLAGRSVDRVSRRLTLLFRNEYLDRPLAQVDRFREGGSQPLVYGLGKIGARFLKEKVGMAIGATDWRSRNRTYVRENLDHVLATSHFLIDLELACRARADVSLVCFADILANAPEATRRSRFPMTWPVPIQWHGGKTQVQVAPDGIFGLRYHRGDGKSVRAYFFLEIDRGTMTIVPSERVRDSEAFPYRATILRKLYAYADSYRLDLHKAQYGVQAPRVLLLTASESRVAAIRRAANEHVVKPLRLPPGMFLFGALGSLTDPMDSSYRDASGQAVRLLGTALPGGLALV
ncbi:MAG TPA: replication-relaxation family protein [Rhizomicrobium sp.]